MPKPPYQARVKRTVNVRDANGQYHGTQLAPGIVVTVQAEFEDPVNGRRADLGNVWVNNIEPLPPVPDNWHLAARALVTAFGAADRDLLVTMLAIGAAESASYTQDRGDKNLGNPIYQCDGYSSFGAWQVYATAHHDKYLRWTGDSDPCVWAEWMRNWTNAATAAAEIQRGSGYGAWSTYKNGAYRAHLARAQEVIDELLAALPPARPPDQLLADGFDSPVGDAASLGPDGLWSATPVRGPWFDANPYGNRYIDSADHWADHTGADLNWNPVGGWNADAGQLVKAAASGTVRYAGRLNYAWGNVVIIEHDPLADGTKAVTRSAHLATTTVMAGQQLQRGDVIGTVGRPGGGPDHLHFDLSLTDALLRNPGDWPQLDRARLERDYVDPREFIARHRP